MYTQSKSGNLDPDRGTSNSKKNNEFQKATLEVHPCCNVSYYTAIYYTHNTL